MASGFTGDGAPDFFTGRSTNQAPQPSYRSNLPGLPAYHIASLERFSLPILQQFRPQPISNSSKPHLHGASKKNLNQKFSVAAQEALHPIAEEQFLHNHQESIKAQTKAKDIDELLTTVGMDNEISQCLASPCAAPPVWSKLKPESPLNYFELEEMAELLIEDDGKHELSGMPASPPPYKIPRSLNHFTPWKDCDFIDFKLMEETPEVTKN